MRAEEVLSEPLWYLQDSASPSVFLDHPAADKFRSTCSMPLWVWKCCVPVQTHLDGRSSQQPEAALPGPDRTGCA